MVGWDKEFFLEVVADVLDNNLLAIFCELLLYFLKERREKEISQHLDNNLPPEQVPNLAFLTDTDLIVVLGDILKHLIALERPLLNSRLLPREPQLNIDELLPLGLLRQDPQLFRQRLYRLISNLLNWKVLRVQINILLAFECWCCGDH